MNTDKAHQIRELTTEELTWVSGGAGAECPLPSSAGPTNPNGRINPLSRDN
jgi:hypothetical protein